VPLVRSSRVNSIVIIYRWRFVMLHLAKHRSRKGARAGVHESPIKTCQRPSVKAHREASASAHRHGHKPDLSAHQQVEVGMGGARPRKHDASQKARDGPVAYQAAAEAARLI
jgi:hypothetical protein